MRKHLPWSGIIHLFSAMLAAVGAVWLIATSQAPWTAALYGLTMTFMFVASTASDLTSVSDRWLLRFQRIDHATIFLFIAACYTPLCLFKLAGVTRVALLTAVWVLAACGAAYKLFVFHSRRWLSTSLYLGLGWMAVIAVGPISASLPTAGLVWLFAGAALYTLGALIYATRRFELVPGVFGHHEVWHTMVTAACACHFVLMSGFILP